MFSVPKKGLINHGVLTTQKPQSTKDCKLGIFITSKKKKKKAWKQSKYLIIEKLLNNLYYSPMMDVYTMV